MVCFLILYVPSFVLLMFISYHIKVIMIKTGNAWPDSLCTSAFLLVINKYFSACMEKALLLDKNCLQETAVQICVVVCPS